MHILFAISAHGFGHAAQTGPVVAALRRRDPSLRLTLRTTIPRPILEELIGPPFDLVAEADDAGFIMRNALEVDRDASGEAYERLHEGWAVRVSDLAKAISSSAPDLVVANVPYLTPAAANRAGVPAVAFCSINWADIYRHYFGGRPEAKTVHAHILEAYAQAAAFLKVTPTMAMAGIENARTVGPVARLGCDRRDEIHRRMGVPAGERLVLVAMGGVDLRLPVETWPTVPGVRWLVPSSWRVDRADMCGWGALGLPFVDLVRSADALLTKPGYGLFTEAACNGTAVLYVCRETWPEEPCLVSWLQCYARCLEIERAALERGDLVDSLDAVWKQPQPGPPVPTGADEVAEFVMAFARR